MKRILILLLLVGCSTSEKRIDKAKITSKVSEDGHTITFYIDKIPARSTVELPSGKITYLDDEKESK